VETWVILLVYPDFCRAATQSPPPTIVTAFDSANIFAMAIEPLAKLSVKKKDLAEEEAKIIALTP